jgi:hypothetical protein
VDGHQPSKQFQIIGFSFLHHFEPTSALISASQETRKSALLQRRIGWVAQICYTLLVISDRLWELCWMPDERTAWVVTSRFALRQQRRATAMSYTFGFCAILSYIMNHLHHIHRGRRPRCSRRNPESCYQETSQTDTHQTTTRVSGLANCGPRNRGL